MSTEIAFLLASVGLLVVIHLIEVVHTIVSLGPVAALSGLASMSLPGWRERLKAAATNLTQNLAIFGLLVLAAAQLGVSTGNTVLGATLFFYGRLAHVLVYTFRVPFTRAPAYTVGLAGCILIFLELV